MYTCNHSKRDTMSILHNLAFSLYSLIVFSSEGVKMMFMHSICVKNDPEVKRGDNIFFLLQNDVQKEIYTFLFENLHFTFFGEKQKLKMEGKKIDCVYTYILNEFPIRILLSFQ